MSDEETHVGKRLMGYEYPYYEEEIVEFYRKIHE